MADAKEWEWDRREGFKSPQNVGELNLQPGSVKFPKSGG